MNITLLDDNFDKQLFNEKAINPTQSWEWGEAKRKLGVDTVRVGEFDQDKLINIYQITFHPIPQTSYKIGYLPRSVFPSKDVIDFLIEY